MSEYDIEQNRLRDGHFTLDRKSRLGVDAYVNKLIHAGLQAYNNDPCTRVLFTENGHWKFIIWAECVDFSPALPQYLSEQNSIVSMVQDLDNLD